jgi:phosphatidylserine/phosphatidylglycerophosphate/cardiolipin synthase-like enzyme
MKLGLEVALPWIETVKELAQMQNMDIKAAVVQVAQELRLYRQSWGIQKQIERANQELALINMETIQKQQALTVLRDLLNRGVTESQIVQLINFAGEWNKYWQSSTTNRNFQQPVNGSNNPGSSGGNGYGDNFSVNDLIRLNLLKSTTTNLLKSARRPPGL